MNKLIAGLAIGIAVGVLIAPDKGSNTRKKLSEKGKDLKKQFDEFVDAMADKLDALRGEAEEMADNVSSQAYAQPYSV